MMAGNRRDLPQLVQQVERLTSRPAAKVGAAGMRVLHHLGLLYGLMDNQPAQHRVVEEARSRRDEVPPAVHAGTKAIAMMASGCQVVGSMVVEGDFTFTDEELESLDGPARAYYRAKGEILLSPQLCGGKEASPEWDAQRDGGRIHSILQSALEEVGRAGGRDRLTMQSLNLMFSLSMIELIILGRIKEGCKRGLEILDKLSDEIGRFTNVMVMESLWHSLEAMGYVFWLLGSEDQYIRLRMLRNSLLPYKPEAQAFPAYHELTIEWWRGFCPSFMCKMMNAKFHAGLLAHAPELLRPDYATALATPPPTPACPHPPPPGAPRAAPPAPPAPVASRLVVPVAAPVGVEGVPGADAARAAAGPSWFQPHPDFPNLQPEEMDKVILGYLLERFTGQPGAPTPAPMPMSVPGVRPALGPEASVPQATAHPPPVVGVYMPPTTTRDPAPPSGEVASRGKAASPRIGLEPTPEHEFRAWAGTDDDPWPADSPPELNPIGSPDRQDGSAAWGSPERVPAVAAFAHGWATAQQQKELRQGYQKPEEDGSGGDEGMEHAGGQMGKDGLGLVDGLDDFALDDVLEMAMAELNEGEARAAQQEGWGRAVAWSVSGEEEKGRSGVFPPVEGLLWDGSNGGNWAPEGEVGERQLSPPPVLLHYVP